MSVWSRSVTAFRSWLWCLVVWVFPNAYLQAPKEETARKGKGLVRIRHASVFLNGTKLGEMFWNRYRISATEGSSLEVEAYVPVQGMSTRMATAVLEQTELDVAILLVDGGLHNVKMRAEAIAFDSDAKSGTQTATFRLTGGKPHVDNGLTAGEDDGRRHGPPVFGDDGFAGWAGDMVRTKLG